MTHRCSCDRPRRPDSLRERLDRAQPPVIKLGGPPPMFSEIGPPFSELDIGHLHSDVPVEEAIRRAKEATAEIRELEERAERPSRQVMEMRFY